MKSKRGQISIEFILILLIVIIYIFSVIQPTSKIATESTNDIARLSQAKIAAQKIATGINQLEANQSIGKKTISVLVPKNSTVRCGTGTEEGKIIFEVTMSEYGPSPPECYDSPPPDEICDQGFGCIEGKCSGYVEHIASSTGSTLTCFGGTNSIIAGNKNIFREIVVEKQAANSIRVYYAA